jgi:transposase InsO family protein
MAAWNRSQTAYIEPGSPWKNGYCESFNSKLGDEFLNDEIFYSMREIRVMAERWRPLQHRPATLLAGRSATGTRGLGGKVLGVWRSGNR